MKRTILTLTFAIVSMAMFSSCRGGRALPKPPGPPHRAQMGQLPR